MTRRGTGAEHLFTVSVVTEAPGLRGSPKAGQRAAVCDVLQDADLTLSRGRLVGIAVSARRRLRPKSTRAPGARSTWSFARGSKINQLIRRKPMAAQNGKDLLIKVDMSNGWDV